MIKIVLASHGRMAMGVYDTLQMFCADLKHVTYICGYVDDTPIESQIEQYFAKIPKEDEVLVFTDLLGGSVNSKFLEYQYGVPERKIHLIAGMNLGLILKLLSLPESGRLAALIREAVGEAKESIVYMNEYQIMERAGDEV